MKILVTGTNPRQAGSTRCPLKYATGIEALVTSARACGHDVHWKGVIPGDDLSQYDKVIVYLAPPSSISAMWIYGTLYTLGVRKDAWIGADDWQMAGIRKSFASAIAAPNKLLWDRMERPGDQEAEQHEAVILNAIFELGQTSWDRTLVAPIMDGGDPSKLGLPCAKYLTFDPSGFWREKYRKYVNEYYVQGLGWVFASLLRKDKWLKEQDLNWPIHFFGNRSLKQPRVSEIGILRQYRNHSGVLSPSHDLKGCGWWRARYVLAALAETVLAGDPAELEVLGSDYQYTPKNIELLSRPDIDNIAKRQAQQYWSRAWTNDQLLTWTKEIFV